MIYLWWIVGLIDLNQSGGGFTCGGSMNVFVFFFSFWAILEPSLATIELLRGPYEDR